MRRHHWWTLAAILFLTIGTTVALARQQQNFDEHERLDTHFCGLALKNRELLHDTIHALLDDPGGRVPATQTELRRIEHELHGLIAAADCED